jgi:hypothetical protein
MELEWSGRKKELFKQGADRKPRSRKRPPKKEQRTVKIDKELPVGADLYSSVRIKTGTTEMKLPHLRFEDDGMDTVRVTRVVRLADINEDSLRYAITKLVAGLFHKPAPRREQTKQRIHLVRDLMTRPNKMIISNFLSHKFVTSKAERESWESTEYVRRKNLSAYEMMLAYAFKQVGSAAYTCIAEAIARIVEEAEDTPKFNKKTGRPRKKFVPKSLVQYRTWCVGIVKNVISEWRRTSHGDIEPETQIRDATDKDGKKGTRVKVSVEAVDSLDKELNFDNQRKGGKPRVKAFDREGRFTT